MRSNFLGWIYRMRFIKRWNRMDNRIDTDVDLHSHCLNVSVVAHLLAEIDNTLFEQTHNCERIALLGMYHELAESVTGDLASPIKYASPAITKEIKKLEDATERMCVISLPEVLQEKFASFIIQKDIDEASKQLVKAADDIVALSKAKEEVLNASNVDFTDAKKHLEKKVKSHADKLPAVQWFLDNFNEGYAKTIDKLMQGAG